MLDSRLLEYFIAVARESNITRAAESLHITQPSLTRQIHILEDQLGTQLFIRGKRQMKLTEDGEFLRAKATDILDLMESAEDAFHTKPNTITGNIFLGCTESVNMDLIAEIFEEIHLEQPAIHFNIFSGNTNTIYERLTHGLVDVWLLLGPAEFDGLNYLDLNKSDRIGILMRKDHPLAGKDVVCHDDLAGEDIFAFAPSSHGFYQDAMISEALEGLNIIGTYNLIYNVTFMVRHRIGIALCLENLINTEHTDLCFVPFSPEITLPIYLVTKKYHTQSPAVRYFLNKIYNM